MDMTTMEQSVKELRRLKAIRDGLDAKIESIEKEIKDEMTSSSKYEYSGEDWKVSWNMVSSSRFDQNSFKESHPKLFNQFKKLTESRRFLLS